MEEINILLLQIILEMLKLSDKELPESEITTFIYLSNIFNLICRKKNFSDESS